MGSLTTSLHTIAWNPLETILRHRCGFGVRAHGAIAHANPLFAASRL